MTNTTVKPTRSRALIILAFPVLMLLPIVSNTVGEIKSLQMTLVTCAVTTVLGLILGAGLLALKSVSHNFWGKLLFILGIFALICVYLDVLLFSNDATIRAGVDRFGDLFGFVDGARPLGGLIMLGVVVLGLAALIAGLIWYTGILGIIWRSDDQIVDVFAILFAVSAVSTLLFASYDTPQELPGDTTTDGGQGLSITIVLDAMMGSDGLRTDLPENIKLADEIDAFYRQYGFLHYPKAFSRHFYTIESLPAVLNGVSTGIPDLTAYSTTRGYHNTMIKNGFFDDLHARKMPIHVYQTQYVHVCDHEGVVYCNSLNTSNRLSPHIPSEFQVKSKAFIGLYMLDYALKNSYVTKDVVKVLFQPAYAAFRKYAPQQYRLLFGFIMNVDVTFNSLFDQFATDIGSGRDGAYYGHFMPTHYPFRLDAQCEPVMARFASSSEKAFSRLVETHANSPDQAQRKRAHFYNAYRDHLRCTHSKLAALFDTLKQQGRFDTATITLLGDHGSRISNGYSKDGVSELDLIDNHSTLFAIKQPNGAAQNDPRMISVQQLLMAHQTGAGVTGEVEKTLVLKDVASDTMVLREMPDF